MLATDDLSLGSRIAVNTAVAEGRARLCTISLWEIALLVSRDRLRLGKPTAQWIEESLIDPGPAIEPLSAAIAIAAGQLPGGFRSDPADQIIVATARVTGASLMTRDRRILDYAKAGYLNGIAA